MEEFADIIRGLIVEESELSPLPFESVPSVDSQQEIDRQTVEALWQTLPIDPGA
jgi:hypothetical protein